MAMREFLQSRRKAEYPVFVTVLKALPTGRFDYCGGICVRPMPPGSSTARPLAPPPPSPELAPDTSTVSQRFSSAVSPAAFSCLSR